MTIEQWYMQPDNMKLQVTDVNGNATNYRSVDASGARR